MATVCTSLSPSHLLQVERLKMGEKILIWLQPGLDHLAIMDVSCRLGIHNLSFYFLNFTVQCIWRTNCVWIILITYPFGHVSFERNITRIKSHWIVIERQNIVGHN